MRLGLIADTHGYLGDDIAGAFAGCDAILHAGDVGEGVLDGLRAIAPLTAVRGNNDTTGDVARLPAVAFLDSPVGRIAVVHRLVDAPANGWDILVFGHCHRSHVYVDALGRLHANPGAAGRRGFHRERSVALLSFAAAAPRVELVSLGPRRAAA